MANWNQPTLTSTYTNVIDILKDRDRDNAFWLEGLTPTNIEVGFKRWNATANRFERWNGSAWAELTSSYAINISGTAANATIAASVTLVADATNTSRSVVFASGASGAQALYTDAGLTYNPSTNVLAASISGNAATATNATSADNIAVTNDTTTAATYYPMFSTAISGDIAPRVSSTKLSFNPSTGLLSATGFSGPLTGNATTATTLQTARTINGVSFNGSANITLTANTPNSLTAGNGLTGTTFNGGAASTFAIGTPGSITSTSTNSVTATSHTHALSGQLTTATTGTAPYYGARAWVNFNGTGTVAIRADVNVTSITDLGVGIYRANFTTAMTDANYSTVVSAGETYVGTTPNGGQSCPTITSQLTTSVTVQNNQVIGTGNLNAFDANIICLSVFS